MKKLSALFLIVALLMCLSACGKKDSEHTESATQETTAAVQIQSETTQDIEEPSEKAVKIGFIATSRNLNSVANAAMLAMDKVNTGDGMDFEIRVEKMADSTAEAESAYNALVEWGMQILIENASSEISDLLAAKSYTDRLFHLAFEDSAGGGTFRDNRFKIKNADATVASAISDYIKAKHAQSRVAVIYDSDDQKLRETHDALSVSLQPVCSESYNSKKSWDFTKQVVSCFEQNADVVILLTEELPASLIVEHAEAMGYKPLFIGVKQNSKILSAEGFNKKTLGNMIFMTDFSVKATDEKTAGFAESYKQLYDENPDISAAYTYDLITLLDQALAKAEIKRPGTGMEKICKKLVSVMPDIVFDGVSGESITWDKKGEVSRICHITAIKDGKAVTG